MTPQTPPEPPAAPVWRCKWCGRQLRPGVDVCAEHRQLERDYQQLYNATVDDDERPA